MKKTGTLLLMVLLVVFSVQAFAAQAPPAFVLKWGEYGSGDEQFDTPFGVAVDIRGKVFVTDWGDARIQKFDGDGNFLLGWGSHCYLEGGRYCADLDGDGPMDYGDGQFAYPAGVAVDLQGNVYVADHNNHRIQKFDGDGDFLLKWGGEGSGDGQFSNPFCVAVDPQGSVYVTQWPGERPHWNDHRIQKFDGDGNFLHTWGGEGSGDGQFSNPSGVAVDSRGYIYVADWGNDRIQKFDREGKFLLKWGTYGSGDGQFRRPFGVAVDRRFNIYVADHYNDRIQKFDSDGNFLLTWGGEGSGDGQFKWPTGVAVDRRNNVYVAEAGNHRIQKFK